MAEESAYGFPGLEESKKILQGLGGDTILRADSKNEYGRTPLSWAAEQGHEAVVKLLVERDDVKANLEDKTGFTPLL
ncbi:hypothetical protein W97_02842 [Coniosporium apollinis CBS 100218]|uniref:Uncharacterized protein n=1 Tax=Coniosporium apollinis (strain CBS 100218) TaxID=1168221 RepID=R7YP92_CONA1|nr:uncharacterized protein W97_02842 [Coniosporium apollinis CBS 100218]EON63614.1 hypothetical protein W97_02842 [Coniosporium apollinis CBS 100218]